MSDSQQSSGQTSTDSTTLRKRAEEQALAMAPISLSAQTPEAIEQMLHELRVHQVELEMQNEELRRAQAEIEAGRARYFDLYDLAPVGYCTLSEKGLILEANLTAATLLGMVRGDLIKQPISRFILKEDQDIYFLHRKQLFETVESQQCELRLVKPDGTPFWAQLTVTAAQEEDGEPVCRCVLSNITERKRADEVLQRNLTMLARTEHIANIGSWEWDIDTDCTRWSEELFRIFQRDPAFGAPSLAEHPGIYVADDMEPLWAAVEMCISDGTPYELELRAIRTDGMIRQCVARGKAERNEKGRIIRLVGSLQDITERKEAEKELRQSESLSRTLVNTIPDLIWLKDTDGVYLSCNKRFERFFGASETEIRGKTDYDFVDEEMADSFREYDRKALAVGGISRNEEQITDADDGYTVFLETIKTPMFDTDGNLVGVLGIGRDITERKKAEEALKEASMRVSLATKAGGVGVWEYDLVQNRLRWDEQMYALYGIIRHAFGGVYDYWRAGVHPEDVSRCDQEVAMALRGEKEFGTEFRVVWPDGTVRHIQALAMVLRDADGKPLRMIGTNWDITERKQNEEALREQRDFSESLIETAQVIVLVLDTQGRIVRFNPYMEQLVGYVLVEVKGMDWFETFLTPEIDRTIKPLFQNTVADIHTSGNVNPIVAKDGRLILVEWYNKTLKDKEGRTVGVLAIGQDITERTQAEAEREKLQDQLQQAQKMEAIGTLAGGIAHDFNNILGAVIGYAEMAREDCQPGSALSQDLDRVLEASNRATSLVKQILAFSRQQDSERVPLDPGFIVKEVVKLLRPSLPSTIAISQRINSIRAVLADPTQVHQVLMNLATNAFHAMEQTGGSLEIAVEDIDCSEADLALHPGIVPGPFVRLSVADTGPGIPPEIRERIFDPYFTTKEIGKGTGMGLAIVDGIVRSLNGFITCECQPGRGTVFTITLPSCDYETTSPDETAEPVATGSGHILLVDDEKILVEMGQSMLERLGYEVTVCTGSFEALTTFQNDPHRFDVVITDQTMPGMTGLDLARRMLQIRPELPIILCTGYSNLVNEAQAKAYGIKGFAMKPLTKKEIGELIRRVLDGRNPCLER